MNLLRLATSDKIRGVEPPNPTKCLRSRDSIKLRQIASILSLSHVLALDLNYSVRLCRRWTMREAMANDYPDTLFLYDFCVEEMHFSAYYTD